MDAQFTPEHEQYIRVSATEAGEPFEWGVNWPSLQKLLPDSPARTLDFGCSGGYMLPRLPGNVREGCDSDPAALALARKHNPAFDYYQWDGLSACPHAPYGLIFAKLVLHFIENLDLAAQNLARALTPGGRLVMSYPHPLRTYQYGQGAYNETHAYKIKMSYVNVDVVGLHRDVQSVVQPFLKAGLALTGIDEVHRPAALAKKPDDTAIPNRLNLAFSRL